MCIDVFRNYVIKHTPIDSNAIGFVNWYGSLEVSVVLDTASESGGVAARYPAARWPARWPASWPASGAASELPSWRGAASWAAWLGRWPEGVACWGSRGAARWAPLTPAHSRTQLALCSPYLPRCSRDDVHLVFSPSVAGTNPAVVAVFARAL